jgi:hypothetical protein
LTHDCQQHVDLHPTRKPRSICGGNTECGHQRSPPTQLIANHKEEQISYTKYLKAQEAGKELILYGMGNDALAHLKKQYINFGDATVHSMIKHLRNKKAIMMTTPQKYDYKTKGHCKAWDPTMSITAYFTSLNRFQISLDDRGISIEVKEKTTSEVASFPLLH